MDMPQGKWSVTRSDLNTETQVNVMCGGQGAADREITVTHVDTTSNDWIQLVQTVTGSPDSYLAGSTGVFSHASAKSFYEQVAPTASVALVYSGPAQAKNHELTSLLEGILA